MNNSALLKYLKYSTLALGCLMLGIAGFLYSQQLNFIRHGQQTQGTVIKNARHMAHAGDGHVYAAVVGFTTADGQTQQFESGNQSSPAAHAIGDTVEVIYDPQNPSNAQINSAFELYLAVYIVGGIGISFFISGLVIIFINQDRGKINQTKL